MDDTCWQPNCYTSNPHLFLLHANDLYCLGRDIKPCSLTHYLSHACLFALIRDILIIEYSDIPIIFDIGDSLSMSSSCSGSPACYIRTARPKYNSSPFCIIFSSMFSLIASLQLCFNFHVLSFFLSETPDMDL